MQPFVARRLAVLTCLGALIAVIANSALPWRSAAHQSKLLIEDVEPRSPGSTARLKPGERIVALDGSQHGLISNFAAVPADKNIRPDIEGTSGNRTASLDALAPLALTRVLGSIAFHATLGLIALTPYALLRFGDAGSVHRHGVDAAANLLQILLLALLIFPSCRPVGDSHPELLRQPYVPPACVTAPLAAFLIILIAVLAAGSLLSEVFSR